MPPFEEQFSEEQRWALASYIRSFSFVTRVGQVSQTPTAEPGLTSTESPEDFNHT